MCVDVGRYVVCIIIIIYYYYIILYLIRLIVMPVELAEHVFPISYSLLVGVKTVNVHSVRTCNKKCRCISGKIIVY